MNSLTPGIKDNVFVNDFFNSKKWKMIQWIMPILRISKFLTTQTPTQKFKNQFSMLSYQEIGSSLLLFQIIFEALQSELFRFKFHTLSETLKTNIFIGPWTAEPWKKHGFSRLSDDFTFWVFFNLSNRRDLSLRNYYLEMTRSIEWPRELILSRPDERANLSQFNTLKETILS